jgi:hypothetical protein
MTDVSDKGCPGSETESGWLPTPVFFRGAVDHARGLRPTLLFSTVVLSLQRILGVL